MLNLVIITFVYCSCRACRVCVKVIWDHRSFPRHIIYQPCFDLCTPPKLKLKASRKENRIIGTANGDMEVNCPIHNLKVNGVGNATGKFTIGFADLDLSMLSSVANIHPEIQRKKYSHLKAIWLSQGFQWGVARTHGFIWER